MNVQISVAEAVPSEASAVGHLVYDGLEPADDSLEIDSTLCELKSFSGKAGESVADAGGTPARVLVGAGDAGKFSTREMRRAAATFARAVPGVPVAALDLRAVGGDGLGVATAVQAASEGIGGATYRFAGYRSHSEPPKLESVVLVVPAGQSAEAERGLKAGLAAASAVWLARDLGNTPPTDMTPRHLADVASGLAQEGSLTVEVFDEDKIRADGLGGVLGVSRGSAEPPRVIKLTYSPADTNGDVPTVALVGKGITFDSGGLSLKTGDGMMTMKDDMSGAGAVISVLGACADSGVKVKVVGFAMCSENLPSGTATKPGDVLKIRNGKTIEVLNTDAEGRLVLADGLSLAVEEGADAIVDIATLTGACMVALGGDVAGLMSNDSRLASAVATAAERAGEPVWQLPLPQQYKKNFESDIADMKNIGRPGSAGALVAGLLLEEFVGDRPWVHLDIAGPAYTDDDSFDRRKGCTGFVVRTLINFLANYEAIGSPADLQADGSVR
ncbi:MAG TPA: leucyl aminopeptidase [Acidimicrobiales bacterium]|nr:leucyl aminopeptidase [Acidimicrobiales bacterium]